MGRFGKFKRHLSIFRASGLSDSTDELAATESEQGEGSSRATKSSLKKTQGSSKRERAVNFDVQDGGDSANRYDDMYTINPTKTSRKDSMANLNLPKLKKSWRSYVCSFYGQIVMVVICMICVGFLFPFILMLYYPLIWNPPDVGVCSIKTDDMFDCFPGIPNVTQLMCDQWDCCWIEKTLFKPSRCYHRFPSSYTLKICPGHESNQDYNYTNGRFLDRELCSARDLGPLDKLDRNYANSRFRVIVQPVTATRVKIRVCKKTDTTCILNSTLPNTDKYLYTVTSQSLGHSVNVVIKRSNSNDEPVFAINFRGNLIVTDNYTETTVTLPEDCNVYGLGFNAHVGIRRRAMDRSWDLLANYTDFGASSAMYGVHPTYIGLEASGNAHGVFFDNKYIMNVKIDTAPAITFKTLGGQVVFQVALGPTPLEVFSQMSEIEAIGKPFMPPYWALGFHMCQTSSHEDSMKTINEMDGEKIPFESDCINADFWKLRNFDPSHSELDEFTSLRSRMDGRKLLAVVFPQVPTEMSKASKEIYEYGVAKEVFVKKDNNCIYHGSFFGEQVAYPDVYHPGLHRWMVDKLNFDDFDGFILNWNMPVDMTDRNSTPCTNNSYNNPIYNPNGIEITQNTLCMDTNYMDGLTHSDVHNSYSLRHMKKLHNLLSVTSDSKSKKRRFLVSLGTSPGMGQLGGHWGGEYPATWEAMKMSLVMMLETSIYGIPFSGVPICGHGGHADEELCLRWMQLGAFYPLSLMYYNYGEKPRHPAAFGKAFSRFTKTLLNTRYSLLPYLYTCFYHAHTTGIPVLRALVFEFPRSEEAASMDTQFLWGPALMIVPSMEKESTTTRAWLPPGVWYDYYTGRRFSSDDKHVSLPSPEFYVNLLVRGGHVIVIRKTENIKMATDTLLQGMVIMVAVDNGEAKGDLYLDDGESEEGPWALVKFYIQDGNTLMVNKTQHEGALQNTKLNLIVEEVKVFGVDKAVTKITMNSGSIKGTEELCENSSTQRKDNTTVLCVYDMNFNVLYIRQRFNVLEKTSITWFYN